MNKLILLLSFFLISINLSAQSYLIRDNIEATQSFTLFGKKVTRISTDITGASKNDNYLITERAAKLYADNLVSSSGWGLNGNVLSGIEFLGSTNNFPLLFRINNVSAGKLDSSSRNTYLGYGSGNLTSVPANLYNVNNTAIGFRTLQSVSGVAFGGINNTGLGAFALTNTSTGGSNSGFGTRALELNTIGSNNMAIGHAALSNNTTGGSNVGIGVSSLIGNTIGNGNIGIGFNANVLSNNLTNATAIGTLAAVSANNSMVLGSIAGVNSAIVSTNVGMGVTAPSTRLHVNGGFRLQNGSEAANYILQTDANGLTTWVSPLLINSKRFGVIGEDDIASQNRAFDITGFGFEISNTTFPTQPIRLQADENATTIGGANTAIQSGNGYTYMNINSGQNLLYMNGDSIRVDKRLSYNSNINGTLTLHSLVPKSYVDSLQTVNINKFWGLNGNVVSPGAFIGTTNSQPLILRQANVFSGKIDNLTANAFYGTLAGNLVTTGFNNVAVGNNSLAQNITGFSNTAIGTYALNFNTANQNTAVGQSALVTNTTGGNNTALGYNADVSANNLTNATVIGNGAIVTSSNAVQLGNGSVTQIFAGVGNTATLNTGGLRVSANSPAANKVLTAVDGTGLSTWSFPSVTSVTGILPIANGGTNSGTALNNNRIMQSSSGSIIEAAAITANRALISDANGIPTHSAVTNTELGFVSGVTSAIQTQLNSKEPIITAGTNLQYYRGDKTFQTLNTTVVPEGSNLYYTDSRSRQSISLTTSGNSGAATYSNVTGILNIPQYTLAGLGGESPLTFNNGLTRSGNTITNDFRTGIAGGNGLYGGLNAGDNLVINSTNNAAKGKTFFGTASAYDEANIRLGIGVTSPTNDLEVGSTITGAHTMRINAPFASNATVAWSQGSTTAWSMYRVASTADLRLNDGTSDRVWFNAGGNVGIGVTPTAGLTLRGGSSSASQAPLKFTSGPLLTTPETGAFEFNTNSLYFTQTSGTQRKTVAFQEDMQGNLLATVSGVNYQTVGVTNLYTVPAGKKAIITAVIFTSQTATGAVTPPTIGVGIAAGEQDICPSTVLTAFNAANEAYKFPVSATFVVGQSGDIIKLGIDNAAGGTAFTGTVKVFGYLE